MKGTRVFAKTYSGLVAIYLVDKEGLKYGKLF